MGLYRCDSQVQPPGMSTTVCCALEPDHSGLHYYAQTTPTSHIAISWHSVLPMPVSISVAEDDR